MRAHVIENGKVSNTIEIASLALGAALGLVVVDAALGGKIGDHYNAQAGTFSPAPTPAPTEAELVAGYEAEVEKFLQAGAASMGFDSIITAVSYAEEPAVPLFQQQGQALRAWRSLTWAKCREVLASVKAGDRPAPTYEQLLAELPELNQIQA